MLCVTVLHKGHVHPRLRRPLRAPALGRRRHRAAGGRDEARDRGGEEQGEMRDARARLRTILLDCAKRSARPGSRSARRCADWKMGRSFGCSVAGDRLCAVLATMCCEAIGWRWMGLGSRTCAYTLNDYG